MQIPAGVIQVVLIGAGGHGRVVLDAARTQPALRVVGFIERDPVTSSVDGVPVIGDDAALESLISRGISHGVVTLGAVQPTPRRAALFERMRAAGLAGAIVVHAAATVASSAELGAGTVVLARAVVNPGARIGRNVIVNTGAVVEHDVEIGDHVNISSGALLAGGVRVGDRAHVGIGATIIEGIRIGAGALVAAGAVVVSDVADGGRVAGIPARPMAPSGHLA